MARKDVYCYKWNNGSCQFIGIIDDYISCFFKRSYSGVGKWELHINGKSNNIEVLKQTDFIRLGNGVCGVVNTIEHSKQDKEVNIISGTELKGIAEKRIIIPSAGSAYQSFTNKSPEYIIAGLLNQQLVSASDGRSITGDIAAYTESATTIDYQGRFENVGQEVCKLAESYNIGWYADINTSGLIEWHIYHGIDRTASQSVNNRLIISEKYDNIKESQYKQSIHPTTTLLVAGQGEGTERAVVYINQSVTGFARSEAFVDARDIDNTTDLYTRGNEKLAAYGDTITMSATPEKGMLINQYRTDYDLGDIGTLLDFNENIRITEIEEVYEDGQADLHFTFGYNKKTLSAVLQGITTKTESVVAKEGYGGGIDFNAIYPIGSIYMNINGTNPATLFGIGTWERIKNVFLLGCDGNSGHGSGTTGGSEVHTPAGWIENHALTINEIPSHNHTYVANIQHGDGEKVPSSEAMTTGLTVGGRRRYTDSTNYTGNGWGHNHNFYGTEQNTMPPYLCVYMWKRIA